MPIIVIFLAIMWLSNLLTLNLLLIFGTATIINVTAFGLIFIGLSITLIGSILILIFEK